MRFLSYLVSGLGLGSVYAIIALGYTMVYGIAKMLNFAHGDIIMIGAYASFFALTRFGMPVLAAVPFAVIVCTVLGVVIERLAYKPLRKATSLSVLITAIGVSYFLQNAAQLLWSSSTKVYPAIVSNGALELGELKISYLTLITIVTCIVVMVCLTLFINHTKTGSAMRACAEDKGAAMLMGINVNRIISLTFAIGSALAAIAAVLLCATYPQVYPTLGSMPGIKAFTAAVFGGIGSIPGAFVGGLLLGIIEILSRAYISTQLADAIVFGVLVVVLLIKPTGILGKKLSEKV
ncbi:MAG: branched-chain amino acid ABC transporter permease [Lachnospiraceae bacterium]|nr:branched-chain amino acid ABC transporter permease [Lachnospiraceae bacterium]